MAYERYKTVVTKEEFFKQWNKASTDSMTAELKEYVYQQYVLKCIVFQRDEFKCKNVGCKTPEADLTIHHIKFRVNGGKDTPRNCACICKICHQSFHKGRIALTIEGATYKLHQEKKLNWREQKKQLRTFRKNLKMEGEWSVSISFEMFMILMKFLDVPYEDMLDEIGDD